MAAIKEMLRKTGLKPAQLAERSGLAATTLTRFVNGKAPHLPTLRTYLKISAYSGVPVPNVLSSGDAEPLPSPKHSERCNIIKGFTKVSLTGEEIRLIKLWRGLDEAEQEFFSGMIRDSLLARKSA